MMESGALFQQKRRGLYVAYDHARDAAPYASFARHFGSLFRLERDNSLARELGDEDAESHVRWLGEGPIAGCRYALVLCGAATHLSGFVDWEIKAALDRRLALMGVILPSNPGGLRDPILPERLRINFDSGYAIVARSDELLDGRVDLGSRLAFAGARPMEALDNSLPLRARDLHGPDGEG
jgi:hypothetical protein